jgi:hypothetical protein
MKKIMLGLVAAFALAAFSAPVRAQEPPAGDTAAPKKEKKGKKGKKGEKTEEGGAKTETPPAK